MLIIAVLYFLVVILGFGFSLNLFFRFTDEFEEGLYKLFSILVIGFGFFGLMLFAWGLFRLPIHYSSFLVLSLGMPFYCLLFKRYTFPKFNISPYQIILFTILALFFGLMVYGTFSYDWLEDDDPWSIASAAKFVSVEQSYHTIPEKMDYNYYLFPHSNCMLPVIYGLLNQVSGDLYSILKLFINIFLLLGVIAFFLFALHFSKKSYLFAIIATSILVITPCFAGHFIFNYGLSVVMLLIFLFSFSLAISNKRYIILSAMMLGSVLIAHPAAGFQAAFILLIFIVYYFFIKRTNVKTIFIIGILGLLFSGFFYADFLISKGFSHVHSEMGVGQGGSFSLYYTGRSYEINDISLADIVVAHNYSGMDQETGVGIVLFIICIVGIGLFFLLDKRYDKQNCIFLILFLFYLLFLWIFTGGYFHFSLQNYRWWSMFAVFIALHAAATIMIMISLFNKTKLFLGAILAFIVIGLLLTSAYPRYTVQTSQWPPGAGWSSQNQLDGYLGLKELGYNKRIFSICADSRAIANNQLSQPWLPEVHGYNKFIRNASIKKDNLTVIQYIETNLNEHDYVILDSGCINNMELDTMNELIGYLMTSNHYAYMPKYSNAEFLLFGVVK